MGMKEYGPFARMRSLLSKTVRWGALREGDQAVTARTVGLAVGQNQFTRTGALRTRRHLSQLTLALAACAVLASGCTRTSPFSQAPVQAQPRAPKPLTPAPQSQVRESTLAPVQSQPSATVQTPAPQSTELPAPTAAPAAPAPIPAEPKPVEVASAEPSGGAPLTRQALVGAWTVSTGGANCQLFLALTKWSGGYRAAPRGCGATGIKSVSAWDVKGSRVVLVSSGGQTLATLAKASGERYTGSVSSGGGITFSR